VAFHIKRQYIHTCVLRTDIHTNIHTHTYIFTYMHTYLNTYRHTYIYTYIYIYIHTHTHIHIYICISLACSGLSAPCSDICLSLLGAIYVYRLHARGSRLLACARQRTSMVITLASKHARACTPYTYVMYVCMYVCMHMCYMACMLGRRHMRAQVRCKYADACAPGLARARRHAARRRVLNFY
jgi:hypothetical protein